ncbi:MAG: dTDP-glucose 4,6-dehydratase [Sphingopyxis sp.]|nr:dTDP-glucose 4,6-dehydratase [Sphingopyxis sp.]
MRIAVTGGCGFIGSAVIRHLVGDLGFSVLNIDKMTYAANSAAVESVSRSPNYRFAQADILDRTAIDDLFRSFRPEALYHLAAESHVDRSISEPDIFVETNVLGTQRLIGAVRTYLGETPGMEHFRMIHVSTDEVFGELGDHPDSKFTEDTPYDPRSPYSASKAASDHLIRAAINTYGLPALITNCSNNYGPFQNEEKLIPLMISRALSDQPLPVYGQGHQIRDWLYVEDHARGIVTAHQKGAIGRSYNFGGNNEMRNIDVVNTLCALLQDRAECAERLPASKRFADLISFVTDRAGHDFRYAIDASRARDELGWEPSVSFDEGLSRTVAWYVDRILTGETMEQPA